MADEEPAAASPPPANEAVRGKKTAKQGMDYLKCIIKYFKSCGFVLPIWVLGYFNFSPAWVLLGLFGFVMGNEYKKIKDSRTHMAKDLVTNEKAAILARTEDLPSWVFFPDVERAEWLNKMIKQMWPYIGEYAKDLLKTSVEPAVQNSLPNSLKPFKFERIDLGDIPPRIGGVKVYIENVKRDEIILDFELFYASDSQIKVAVRGLTAGIKDLTIHGHMRVVMRPLVQVIPIIGGLQVFFLNQPTVDFDLTNTANMLDVPLLSNTVRGIIVDQLSYYMVLPNKLPIQLADVDMTAFKYPQPAGVVRIHVVAARDLKKADFKVVGKGKSDPYCKIYIGAKTFKTKVIENTIAPTWNAYFEGIVDQSRGQFIDIDCLDQDPGDDDELGSCSVDLEQVANNGSMDSWLPLENVKTGMIHLRAIWLHLSKDPNDLDKSEAYNQQQATKSGTDEYLASALLMVTLDSAKDLPRSKKSMSEPSPLVKISVGNEVEKSLPRTKTTDPKWETNFYFLISDPRQQDVRFEVIDSNKDKKLGSLVVPIKTLLGAPDMVVNRPYRLMESGTTSKLTLRLCLRVLTSELPAAWARDDLPTHTTNVAEGGTSVDTGTGDSEPAAADTSKAPAAPGGGSPSKQPPSPAKKALRRGRSSGAAPTTRPLERALIDGSDRVFYDLETSGLGSDAAILQLSAVCGSREFDRYVAPPPGCSIHPAASAVNHLRVERGQLTYRHQPVQTRPVRDALREFIGWLRALKRPILLGHNIKKFDNPLLFRDLVAEGLVEEFGGVCVGFIDTLELFRAAHPERSGRGALKQETLVSDFLGGATYDAHNGLEDVRALQRLFDARRFDATLLHQHSFDLQFVAISQGRRAKDLGAGDARGTRDATYQPTGGAGSGDARSARASDVAAHVQQRVSVQGVADDDLPGVEEESIASSVAMETKAATLPSSAGSELRQRAASNGAAGGPNLGSIQLTIRYSEQRQRLILVVHKCINLVGYDDDNMSDPYVRVYLLPDNKNSKRKTQTIKNDLNPIYDETFDWAVSLSEASGRSLDILVKNKNSMFSSAKTEMGGIILNLSQLDLTKAHTDWFDLNDPEAPPKQILVRSTTT